MAPWANGKNGKEFRATFGRRPIVGIASIGIDDEHRWKDSVTTAAELRLWLADGIANGLRPWVAKFSGVLYDRRWVPVVERVYDWHFRNERYLRNEENLARVAMVYSQQTGTYYGGEQKHRRVEDHELGMYQALVEARIPFEMAHDRLLDAEHVDRYRLLILPNVAALSDAQCEQLRQYVKRGGSMLATFETSLYDERGNRRKDFGLADLFGVSYGGKVEARHQERVHADRGADEASRAGRAGGRRADHRDGAAGGGEGDGAGARPARDARAVVPGLADGGGLPARAEDGRAGGLLREAARGGSSTSPATSTGRSGRSWRRITACCCGMRWSGR